MSVLVTGGAGYIGSHMDLALLDNGYDVIVVDDLSAGFRLAVPDHVKFIRGDIGDIHLLREIITNHRIDTIIHFAGKTVVPESIQKPLQYYGNNTVKTHALISCAVSQGVNRFIFSSTAAVYGDKSNNPVRESDPVNPITPYGRSKLMIEWMLEDLCKVLDIRCVILRYFNVAGADPQGRTGQSTHGATHLIKITVQAALGIHPKMSVFGADYSTPDGTCIRDFVQVTDLCQAHIDALNYLKEGGCSITCNCGYGKGYSVFQIIEAVKRVSGVDFPVEIKERRPGDRDKVVSNSAKIKKYFGWKPKYDDLYSIVGQAYEWEKYLITNPKGYM
jgi:UDP-glucose 4-epimerase